MPQVNLSAFAFLFSELVQYCQQRVSHVAELENRYGALVRLTSRALLLSWPAASHAVPVENHQPPLVRSIVTGRLETGGGLFGWQLHLVCTKLRRSCQACVVMRARRFREWLWRLDPPSAVTHGGALRVAMASQRTVSPSGCHLHPLSRRSLLAGWRRWASVWGSGYWSCCASAKRWDLPLVVRCPSSTYRARACGAFVPRWRMYNLRRHVKSAARVALDTTRRRSAGRAAEAAGSSAPCTHAAGRGASVRAVW